MPTSAAQDNPAPAASQRVIFADNDARALLAGKIDDLSHPDSRTWQIVKQNASRTVYRGRIDGQVVYLKHFRPRPAGSALRRLARKLAGSKARDEMRHSQYVRAHGVATAPPLAALCGDDVEWFATRAVAPAEPCNVWHEKMLARGPEGRKAVQQAIAALANMVGRMHQVGILHRDLHCGNLLVRTDHARPRLVLTDLHRVRCRRGLSRRARAANLAQLLHDRLYTTTRTERLRFLKQYLRASGAKGTLRGWQVMVEDLAHRHTRRQHSQRDRRVSGDNRYFHRVRLPGGWRGHVVLASKRKMAGTRAGHLVFTVEDWREALAEPLALLDREQGEVKKDSPSSFVIRREVTVGGHRLDVHIKRAMRKQSWKIVLDCFRPARSIRAFALGHQLLTRWVATALPLAAIQRRRGPFLFDSILITETVRGLEMNQFLNHWLSRAPRNRAGLDDKQKRLLASGVLRQLGQLLRRLHDSKFAHRDLKASNMLILWDGHSPPEAALVDLDGLWKTRFLTTRERFQGLMRLNVSVLECPAVNRAGRLRMLLAYLRRPGCGPIGYKPYWRALERWSAWKLRKQIHDRRKRQKAVRGPVP